MGLRSLIVNVLSCADYISQVTTALETVARGGGVDSWVFYFSFADVTAAGWSPFHVIGLLADCQPWGYALQADTVLLNVPMEYASQAQYLLDRAGVPIKSGRYE